MDVLRHRGFTLLEVLVVMALAGILLAIAIPDFVTFMQNNTRAATTNDLLASMHIARSESITRNGRVTICPSSEGTACDAGDAWEEGWLVFYDENGNLDFDGNDQSITYSEGNDDYEIGSAVFETNITYRSNGRAMAQVTADNSGEFILCDARGPDYSRVIIIPPSGRPRSSETLADGSTPTACL